MLQKYISHTQNFEKEKSVKHRKIGKNTIKMHEALQTYTHTLWYIASFFSFYRKISLGNFKGCFPSVLVSLINLSA